MNDSDAHEMNQSDPVEVALAKLASVSPHLDDELLAERVETELAPAAEDHTPLRLTTLLAAVPLLRSRPVSLDAALDVIVRAGLANGMSGEDIEAQMLEDAPDFAESIAAHMALRGMLTSATPAGPHRKAERRTSLPTPFGPESPGGQRRYELVERIGTGSEGTVYRAFDRRIAADGRPMQVAVKILHRESHDFPDHAADEVARVMRVRHDAVLSLLDWGHDGESAYLVYEFIEGRPLHAGGSRSSAGDLRRDATMVLRLARGVQAMHNAGVAHRDIKPNNILVDAKGMAFLADFGLASALRDPECERGGGSLAFASPEQLNGSPGLTDNTVDVYALGGVLYWLLTGVYPNGQTRHDAQRHIINPTGGAAETAEVEGRDAKTLLAIARKALAPKPADRYTSADALAADLSRWLAREPVLPFDAAPSRQLGLAIRRSPMTFAAAGVALLAIAAIAWAAWRVDANKRQSALMTQQELYEQEVAHQKSLLEKDRQRIDEARELVREMGGMASRYLNRDGDTTWLAMFNGLEAISQRGLLDLPGVGEEIVGQRIELTADFLSKSDGSGTRDTIEMAMWETALGYWQLQAGRFEDALVTTSENAARVRSLVATDDPWVTAASALYHLAKIGSGRSAVDAAASSQWLEEHADVLPDNISRMHQSILSRDKGSLGG